MAELEFFREFLQGRVSPPLIQEALTQAVYPSKGLDYWTVNVVYYALMKGCNFNQIEQALIALGVGNNEAA